MYNHIDARAQRQLRSVGRFHHASALDPRIRRQLVGLELVGDELFIGVYVSEPPDFETAVAVTSLGLRIRRGDGWLAVRYTDIRAVEVARAPGQLTIQLADGASLRVRLSVDPERAPDVHALAIFLDLVRDDLLTYQGAAR